MFYLFILLSLVHFLSPFFPLGYNYHIISLHFRSIPFISYLLACSGNEEETNLPPKRQRDYQKGKKEKRNYGRCGKIINNMNFICICQRTEEKWPFANFIYQQNIPGFTLLTPLPCYYWIYRGEYIFLSSLPRCRDQSFIWFSLIRLSIAHWIFYIYARCLRPYWRTC